MAPTRDAVPLFVDTSAWVALLHRPDQAHRHAAELWPGIRSARRLLVTTNLVLAETHATLMRRIGPTAGLSFLDRMTDHRFHRVVWADAELTFGATDRWLRQHSDKRFSLTDAVSFEVMDQEGIAEAFAFDRDFERAGFRLL